MSAVAVGLVLLAAAIAVAVGLIGRATPGTSGTSSGDTPSEATASDRTPSGQGSILPIPADPVPVAETAALPEGKGDVADDSAIYADPVDPARSVVIADDKADHAGGIAVYDLQGTLLQFRQDGKIGNVDLRPGFPLGGRQVVLVGANNRSNDTLIFWVYDPATRALSAPVNVPIPTVADNYGFTMYHSAVTGKFFAFVTQETGHSTMQQFELSDDGTGHVTATRARSFDVGSITEGCVADDERGVLYVGQEDVGLWRYGAEPGEGATRTLIGKVGDGHLKADVEGMALTYGPDGDGLLVVSSQGNSTFAVYDRRTGAFRGSFSVGANHAKGIDATTQTDGLDITTANAGPGFSQGVLVVHDGSNPGDSTSNLKLVPLG